MSKIKNLKPGKSIVVDGLEITKGDKCYEARLGTDMVATFAYAPANRWWVVLLADGEVMTLPQTTLDEVPGKIAGHIIAVAEDTEAAAEPSKELALPEPAGEVELAAEVIEAELVDEDEESEDEADETATQLDYDVDTKGGHSPHRLTALATIANAAGATVDKHVVGGWNSSVTLTALVPASQVDSLTDILQRFEAAVEPLAAAVSKRVSNQARSEGRHHSGPGCHARRGFIRGFGDAVAGKINPKAELEGDFGQNLKYDHDAYLEGLMAGESFQLA